VEDRTLARKPLSGELLSRRDALLGLGALMGGVVGSGALLSGCVTSGARPASELFGAADIELFDAIAETILPATDTPGAKAAGVGAFMTIMVADTYDEDEKAIFFAGVADLDGLCRAEHGVPFIAASPAQRTRLLERLDRVQHDYMNAREAGMPVHYFRMLKELSLQGYFTSEIGYTQAMRYAETPGRFDPCIPYNVGDRAWADHA
jgi:hypothetical protein